MDDRGFEELAFYTEDASGIGVMTTSRRKARTIDTDDPETAMLPDEPPPGYPA